MPELPDVEVFRKRLRGASLRKRIDDVSVGDQRILEVSPANLRRRLRGNHMTATHRHGKLLFVTLERSPHLVLHFGMTGSISPFRDEAPEHAQLLFDFDDGSHLAYVSQRLFGRVDLSDDVDDYLADHALGPDALRLDEEALAERLGGRTGRLKPTLMNQKVVAGLGNIYVDEILFDAKLHPQLPVDSLDRAGLRKLHKSTQKVLRRAIEAGVEVARMPRTWLLPHRDEPSQCPRCGSPLEKTRVGGRGTLRCTGCQPSPKK